MAKEAPFPHEIRLTLLDNNPVFQCLTLLWKSHAENVHQKLVPDPFSILVNNPKQPSLHVRNHFKTEII